MTERIFTDVSECRHNRAFAEALAPMLARRALGLIVDPIWVHCKCAKGHKREIMLPSNVMIDEIHILNGKPFRCWHCQSRTVRPVCVEEKLL